MPSWTLAALVFPLGYVPLLLTDSRLLRPVVLIPLAVLLFARWARILPAPRVVLLLAVFLGCFVLSHVVAAATAPAVGVSIAAVLFGAAAWAVADRPAAWRPART
jgi:hypothetical protein